MFITDAPDNTLTTSVEDWCEGTMESVHFHPIGENFLSHGRLLYPMHEEWYILRPPIKAPIKVTKIIEDAPDGILLHGSDE